uniref:Uncharacterized protein n=1 Tax=Anguilla anguilla TaxID=7936 RepID=A0A0E9WUS5_ANGAN
MHHITISLYLHYIIFFLNIYLKILKEHFLICNPRQFAKYILHSIKHCIFFPTSQ